MTLVEPRRLRADFLAHAVDRARPRRESSWSTPKVEARQRQFDVITARAVAPLDASSAWPQHLSHSETVWVLPKGRNAQIGTGRGAADVAG